MPNAIAASSGSKPQRSGILKAAVQGPTGSRGSGQTQSQSSPRIIIDSRGSIDVAGHDFTQDGRGRSTAMLDQGASSLIDDHVWYSFQCLGDRKFKGRGEHARFGEFTLDGVYADGGKLRWVETYLQGDCYELPANHHVLKFDEKGNIKLGERVRVWGY